jgi:hypothetical protein
MGELDKGASTACLSLPCYRRPCGVHKLDHAASSYSWISPLRRSRRRTVVVADDVPKARLPSGQSSPMPRCGRAALQCPTKVRSTTSRCRRPRMTVSVKVVFLPRQAIDGADLGKRVGAGPPHARGSLTSASVELRNREHSEPRRPAGLSHRGLDRHSRTSGQSKSTANVLNGAVAGVHGRRPAHGRTFHSERRASVRWY